MFLHKYDLKQSNNTTNYTFLFGSFSTINNLLNDKSLNVFLRIRFLHLVAVNCAVLQSTAMFTVCLIWTVKVFLLPLYTSEMDLK